VRGGALGARPWAVVWPGWVLARHVAEGAAVARTRGEIPDFQRT
jgi:hypothetical protein